LKMSLNRVDFGTKFDWILERVNTIQCFGMSNK
jgi:hypothetical protein